MKIGRLLIVDGGCEVTSRWQVGFLDWLGFFFVGIAFILPDQVKTIPWQVVQAGRGVVDIFYIETCTEGVWGLSDKIRLAVWK